jgi:hypothetical protein
MLDRLSRLDDGLCVGIWTYAQLLEMDAAFISAVESSFRLGLESRTAARATVAVEVAGGGD